MTRHLFDDDSARRSMCGEFRESSTVLASFAPVNNARANKRALRTQSFIAQAVDKDMCQAEDRK